MTLPEDCNFEAKTCPEAHLQQEIELLRAEIDRLQGELTVAYGQVHYLMRDQEVKHRLLAEAQAREVELIGHLEDFEKLAIAVGFNTTVEVLHKIFKQPHEHSALDALLAQERERCAEVCSALGQVHGEHPEWAETCATAIKELK